MPKGLRDSPDPLPGLMAAHLCARVSCAGRLRQILHALPCPALQDLSPARPAFPFLWSRGTPRAPASPRPAPSLTGPWRPCPESRRLPQSQIGLGTSTLSPDSRRRKPSPRPMQYAAAHDGALLGLAAHAEPARKRSPSGLVPSGRAPRDQASPVTEHGFSAFAQTPEQPALGLDAIGARRGRRVTQVAGESRLEREPGLDGREVGTCTSAGGHRRRAAQASAPVERQGAAADVIAKTADVLPKTMTSVPRGLMAARLTVKRSKPAAALKV